MDWYFGTEQQIRLQQKVDELTAWCAVTKGAVNGGRFLGTDDSDALGWGKVVELMLDGGVFTFRMVPVEKTEELQLKLHEHGMRFDSWNVFSAGVDTIRQCTSPLVALPLPDGYSLVNSEELSDAKWVSEIQECMARNGVVPFSGLLLSGQSLPSVTIAVKDRNAKIVATAFGYFPYNQFSKWSSTAWGGLVCVDETQRGMKLGAHVNALMVRACVDRLGAKEVQEFAAATNIPSRKMIERSGLEIDPLVMSGIATSIAASVRFTA
jgi:hypothetical protein